MRELKFRAWSQIDETPKMIYITKGIVSDLQSIKNQWEVMQFTGLKDKNKKDIYEGDLLNVFFTSNEKKHIHDCIYTVRIDSIHGIKLVYIKLLWEDYGNNQIPSTQTLIPKYNNLDDDYQNHNYDKLAVQDTWGENHLLQNRWKETDYSNYFKVIGNIYENPELLK